MRLIIACLLIFVSTGAVADHYKKERHLHMCLDGCEMTYYPAHAMAETGAEKRKAKAFLKKCIKHCTTKHNAKAIYQCMATKSKKYCRQFGH